jgi:hypothetical protein
MEDVIETYHLPYDERFPLVCMDESCRQLVGEVAPPLPMAPGRPCRIDHEYVRHGWPKSFSKWSLSPGGVTPSQAAIVIAGRKKILTELFPMEKTGS